jgi:hypothetical protein
MQYLLESVRRSRKESQESMAKLINVDVRTYQNKERGVTQFKQNEMFIIAKHFNRKVDELFLPTNFENHEVLNSNCERR